MMESEYLRESIKIRDKRIALLEKVAEAAQVIASDDFSVTAYGYLNKALLAAGYLGGGK
jgi:hypothetical protein